MLEGLPVLLAESLMLQVQPHLLELRLGLIQSGFLLVTGGALLILLQEGHAHREPLDISF